MKRNLLIATVVVVLATAGFFVVQSSKSEPVMCTLTGQTVDRCCCETRDGKIYCPLADKTIEECCCEAGGKRMGSNQARP